MLVQYRVDESQRALPDSQSFLHDTVHQRCEDGTGGGCSTLGAEFTSNKQGNVITVGGHIGNTTSVAVVKTAVGSVQIVAVIVVGIWGVVVLEVCGDSILLVAWDGKDVGETLWIWSAYYYSFK